MTQQKKAMACQTIPQVAGWKTATMMKHYARVLDAWRAREITRGCRSAIGHKAVKRHGVTKVALGDRQAARLSRASRERSAHSLAAGSAAGIAAL
jgi:hypothetical protein